MLYLAYGLICIFHVGSEDREKPLRDGLEPLLPVHTRHVGLGTFSEGLSNGSVVVP